MAGTAFFGVVRAVHRIAWWVFVVTAIVAGGVDWWPWGDQPAAQYRGSFAGLQGVTTIEPLGSVLVSDVDGGGPPWAGPVTLVAAALVVAAAASASTIVRSTNWEGAIVILAGAAVAIGTVAFAVNGYGGNSFGPGAMVALIVMGAAIHEAAMAVSAMSWRKHTAL